MQKQDGSLLPADMKNLLTSYLFQLLTYATLPFQNNTKSSVRCGKEATKGYEKLSDVDEEYDGNPVVL